MYQEQIPIRNLQKETLQDYRNRDRRITRKVSVLKIRIKTLSAHLVEKKGNIPDMTMVIFMLSTCKDFVYCYVEKEGGYG